MKKINIAIIGYGGMGSYHVRNWLKGDERYCVRGIYDIDEARYAVAKKDGIEGYDRYHSKEDVANDSALDAVLIATPNDCHLEYVTYFARAGKHVVCEKPVALTSEEYAAMVRAGEENGVVFTVHQNRRWDPDFLTIKKMYDSGEIGKFCRVESRVQGGNGIPGDWRKFKEKGGGMMLDWGVHMIDQFVTMVDELPESVYCRYSYEGGFEVDDGFRLIMNYKNGLVAEIVVDTDCYVSMPRWTVYGKEGTAVIEDWELHGKIVKPVFSKDLKIAGITAGNGFTKTMAYRTADSVNVCELQTVFPEKNAFYTEFYAAVTGEKEMCIRPEQVAAVMKIMEAASVSARENRVVTMKY